MSEPQPVHVDGCLPPPLRSTLEALAQNDRYLIQLGDDVRKLEEQVNKPVTFLNGKPAKYYNSAENLEGDVNIKQRPLFKIQLTTGFTRVDADTYYATARKWLWTGSSYGLDTEEFRVYEIFREYRHALSGDRGWMGWDQEREVYYIEKMCIPSVRYVTLDADLGRDAHVSGVDKDTGQAISWIVGTFVPTGKKIESTTSRVKIDWFPYADALDESSNPAAEHDGDGCWRASTVDVCLVDA